MRNFITLALCFTASLCFGQDQTLQYKKLKGPFSKVRDTVLFANTSVLRVENELTKSENYQLVKKVLPKLGIKSIDNKRRLDQVTTDLIPMDATKPDLAKYTITVWCMNNKLRMTCQDKSKRKYYDRKNGIIMFAKMKEVADQMGGKIYYTN
ncbi:MAG: hypothetical protein EOO86_06645 [Pedobacter sp.]|nr:MAG: hypothetical protein EOO86_06645 [Pedobacter sp.]